VGPLKKLVEEMRGYFDAQDKVQEQLLDISRKVIRNSSRAITATHRLDKKSALGHVTQAKKDLRTLQAIVKENPQFLMYGAVLAAQQEYAEAELFRNLVENGKLLSPKELGVTYHSYLTGVADLVGEMRRNVLDAIRRNEVGKAEKTLELMERLFELLMEFDYAESVVHGIKRRQDVARQVVEKTRGDLTLALRQDKLEKALRRKR
jgi:translin